MTWQEMLAPLHAYHSVSDTALSPRPAGLFQCFVASRHSNVYMTRTWVTINPF